MVFGTVNPQHERMNSWFPPKGAVAVDIDNVDDNHLDNRAVLHSNLLFLLVEKKNHRSPASEVE